MRGPMTTPRWSISEDVQWRMRTEIESDKPKPSRSDRVTAEAQDRMRGRGGGLWEREGVMW